MAAISKPTQRPVQGPFRRFIALRTLCLLALLGLTLNLRAELQFDVFLGLDNYVSEASWFPIVCEINNDGPAFDGVIEVTGGSMNLSGFTRLVPVELPTGTRKRVTIPVFCASSYNVQWNVILKDAAGRARKESPNLQPRGTVKRNTVLLGSLARSAGWVPTFKKPLINQSDLLPVAARLQPALFPDNSIVLEGVDALYLNSERAADLRAQQVSAIQSWINTGGHLILAVEQISDVNSSPWLRALVPMDLAGVSVIPPDNALENWLRSPVPRSIAKGAPLANTSNSQKDKNIKVTLEAPFSDTLDDAAFNRSPLSVATGKLRGGRTVVAAGETPLIVSALQGNGRITVLLFSPEREPAKSWKNQPVFWARLTGVPARWYASAENHQSGGWGMDGIFGAMVDSRQIRKLPIFWLLLMLLAYLAIIGPVDQIWLRKINKPMLTWITFPCYVALFSGLIYLVGYKLRAGETEWNELHVVDVFTSGGRTELRGHTFGSIYSPVNQRYAFESTAKAAAFRSEFSGNWSTEGGNDRGRMVQSENSFKADVYVPVWTSQLYVSDWAQPADAPFFASVERAGRGWNVTVQNRLDKPLTQVRLVVEGRIYDLGEVPANQKHQFASETATNSTTLTEFVSRHGEHFQSAVQQRRQAFGATESGRINDLPNASMATSFLAQLQAKQSYSMFITPPTFDLSSATEFGNAILLAWSAGYAPIKPLNKFTPGRNAENTLWRLTVPLNSNP